ncbi:MAG: hypothetical protein ACRDSN_13685 [Pseudonocardiaceae bacterium]
MGYLADRAGDRRHAPRSASHSSGAARHGPIDRTGGSCHDVGDPVRVVVVGSTIMIVPAVGGLTGTTLIGG